MKKIKMKKKKKNKTLSFVFFAAVVLFVIILSAEGLSNRARSDSKEVHATNAATEAVTETETETEDDNGQLTDPFSEDEFIVCIDAGHGGRDPGSIVGNLCEADQVLELSLLVRDYLKEQGIRVVMTRTKDVFVPLESRPMFANENEADVIVSIHRNVYEGWHRIYGVEAWIHSNEPRDAVALSDYILDRLSEVEGTNIRGLRAGSSDDPAENYIINRDSDMTSLILEMGYMTDAGDNELFETHKEDYAKAIGLGIMDFMENYN